MYFFTLYYCINCPILCLFSHMCTCWKFRESKLSLGCCGHVKPSLYAWLSNTELSIIENWAEIKWISSLLLQRKRSWRRVPIRKIVMTRFAPASTVCSKEAASEVKTRDPGEVGRVEAFSSENARFFGKHLDLWDIRIKWAEATMPLNYN